MSFVEDVTIPDGTEFVAGATFAKTWRIRNNGCLPWPTGTQLVFFGGDQMGGSAAAMPATNIGATQDVTVNLTAPSAPGTYTGYWQLRAPDLGNFGPHVFVEIEVIASTPTPTATVTQAVTASPTPTYQVFLGRWNNQNADTTNITRMEIRAVEAVVLVHMWNKGVPSDLDRGEASTPTADANDSVLYLSWVEEGFTETQQLSLLMDGRLQVNGQVNYVDASRTDFSYTEYFIRQP
jgi:next-to-BRCA1 protein 1